MYCSLDVLAGIVGGLLGPGGGFILGPLFWRLASLDRSEVQQQPLPWHSPHPSLYFIAMAAVAAIVVQRVLRRLIVLMGRASLMIFILAFTIFMSAISLGGVGTAHTIKEKKGKKYVQFETLGKYQD
uniref:Sulfite exporter TauE/SafE family protein 3-like n=1 Tax=Elaeis guineensis var. tenera TaxID=51953 RepID=A0A8N4ETD7_ELAGV|nr:sulfite exporter TauE/SafE family protein 3-like [Elaeis guineensis]